MASRSRLIAQATGTTCIALGMGTAAAIGLAAVTATAGALLSIAPGATLAASAVGIASGLGTNLVSDLIKNISPRMANRLVPRAHGDPPNHHLQRALQRALRYAIEDIGGPEIFRDAHYGVREVMPEVCYFDTDAGRRYLQEQGARSAGIIACLRAMARDVREEHAGQSRLIPLTPSEAASAASIERILATDDFKALGDMFFDQVIRPFISAGSPAQAASWPAHLLEDAPDFEAHLRRTLFVTTHAHFGELLKRPETTEAWRAFNRFMLEDIRAEVRSQKGASDDLHMLAERAGMIAANADKLAKYADICVGSAQDLQEVRRNLTMRLDDLSNLLLAQQQDTLRALLGINVKLDSLVRMMNRALYLLENGQPAVRGAVSAIDKLPPERGASPYKALDAFDVGDAENFFGREQLTARILSRLQEASFLAIVGNSGSGKSSLARAGVVASLSQGVSPAESERGLAGSRQWTYWIMSPGAHPLEKLSALLSADQPQAETRALESSLLNDPSTLRRAVLRHQARTGVPCCVLLIDQFEELFTMGAGESEQAALLSNLMAAVAPDAGCRLLVLITVRFDAMGSCALVPGFTTLIGNNQVPVEPMTRKELRSAIEKPAARGNWQIEPGLVDFILSEANEQLPLLSYALEATWRNRRGRTMTLESYAETGGIQHAVAQTAEEVYGKLSEGEKSAARNLFLQLTTPLEDGRDVRRRVRHADLFSIASPQRDTQTALQRFSAKDVWLITLHKDSVQIAHEALIEAWARLKDWLNAFRADRLAHQRLSNAATLWQDHGKTDDLLSYPIAQLDEAERIQREHQDLFTAADAEFVAKVRARQDASRREAEIQQQRELAQARQLAEAERQKAQLQKQSTRRLRRFVLGLGVALVFAFGAILFSLFSEFRANLALARAERNLRQMTTLLDDVTQLLSDDRMSGVIGFSAVERDLFTLMLPYHEYIINSQPVSGAAWQRARARYRLGLANEKMGNTLESERELAQAFQEAKSAVQSNQSKGRVPDDVLILLGDAALYHSWNLMNKKEIRAADDVLAFTQGALSEASNTQNPKLLYASAVIENALSRLMTEKNEPQKAHEHQSSAMANMRRAVAMEPANLAFQRALAVYLDNLTLSPRNLVSEEEAQKLKTEACEIARKGEATPGAGAMFLIRVVSCLYDESQATSAMEERLSKLLEARQKLDAVVALDPERIDYKLYRARVLFALADYQKYQVDDAAAQARYVEAGLSDWLNVVGAGKTLPTELWLLRNVYDSIRAAALTLPDEERKQVTLRVADAIAQSRASFGDVREMAFIIADSAMNMGEMLRESEPHESLKYLDQAVAFYAKARIVDDLSAYSEEYTWVCNAYSLRLQIHFARGELEAVLTNMTSIESICLPIFEKYNFDFYLNRHVTNSYMRAGELLAKAGRWREAKPMLEYASKWGVSSSTLLLAQMYAEGQGVPADATRAQELEALAPKQTMKRFTVPVALPGGNTVPFYIYVYQKPADYAYRGIDDQVEWLKQARGLEVQAEVIEAFRRLDEIARENDASLPELAEYATGTSADEDGAKPTREAP